MSITDYLDDVSLPPLIRVQVATYLSRIERAADPLALSLAVERAEGFVEGVEAARALNAATIEALFLAIDTIGNTRRVEMGA